jgi:hypothetical protein
MKTFEEEEQHETLACDRAVWLVEHLGGMDRPSTVVQRAPTE